MHQREQQLVPNPRGRVSVGREAKHELGDPNVPGEGRRAGVCVDGDVERVTTREVGIVLARGVAARHQAEKLSRGILDAVGRTLRLEVRRIVAATPPAAQVGDARDKPVGSDAQAEEELRGELAPRRGG